VFCSPNISGVLAFCAIKNQSFMRQPSGLQSGGYKGFISFNYRAYFDKSHTLFYAHKMTKVAYEYSAVKNQLLIKERRISFEEIVAALDNGQLLDIVEQPNPNKYPNQKMFVVQINNYAYLVPFVKNDEGTVFLKTIFPSRKATKQYIKNEVIYEN
jgi:hypothetical protein